MQVASVIKYEYGNNYHEFTGNHENDTNIEHIRRASENGFYFISSCIDGNPKKGYLRLYMVRSYELWRQSCLLTPFITDTHNR